jgi:hypothetical protein
LRGAGRRRVAGNARHYVAATIRCAAQTLRALASAFLDLDGRGLLSVPDGDLAATHFASLVVGHWIDRALFFGGPETLDGLDVEGHARAAVDAFLAVYRSR